MSEPRDIKQAVDILLAEIASLRAWALDYAPPAEIPSHPEWDVLPSDHAARLAAAHAASEKRVAELEAVLIGLRDYKPREICLDEFAYKRLVATYRNTAKQALLPAPAPDRQEDGDGLCITCGKAPAMEGEDDDECMNCADARDLQGLMDRDRE